VDQPLFNLPVAGTKLDQPKVAVPYRGTISYGTAFASEHFGIVLWCWIPSRPSKQASNPTTQKHTCHKPAAGHQAVCAEEGKHASEPDDEVGDHLRPEHIHPEMPYTM